MNYSKQREMVYKTVMENCSHPTAEKIYEILKKDNSHLSLATVYRNLQQLSEMGAISRISFPSEPDRYDGNTAHHYHGVCLKCGKVVDIHVDYLYDIDLQIYKKTGIKIDSHKIIFKILCPDCAEKVQN